MKLAVLGWGSLIWDPRNLKIKNRKWQEDGPFLPVEFARISRDGRLTLVLYPGAEKVQVLWNYMDVTNRGEGIGNLAKREGTSNRNIGFVEIATGESRCNVIREIEDNIKEWAKQKGLDCAIWTDLCSNFKDREGKEFNEKNVLNYLKSLEDHKKAKEYIIRAPKQIMTKMRRIIMKELGWYDE